MIISFYIFSIVLIISNAELNREKRQTDSILSAREGSLLDSAGGFESENVSFDNVDNISNDVLQSPDFSLNLAKPVIQNDHANSNNVAINESTETTPKKVKKVKRVKVKKLIKKTQASPTEITSDQSFVTVGTESISDKISTDAATTTETPTTTNPTTILKKFTKSAPKFSLKRRTLRPKTTTEISLDTQSTESSTIAVTKASTTEASTTETSTTEASTTEATTTEGRTTETTYQSFNADTVPSTESTPIPSSVEITPITKRTFGNRRRKPTGRLITEKTSVVQLEGNIALEGNDNNYAVKSTVQTYLDQNKVSTTGSPVVSTSFEVTPTLQSSYASRRRRPTSASVVETPAVTTATERSSFTLRGRRPISKFSTEKPVDVQVTQAPASILIQTPAAPTILTYDNKWNVRVEETTKYFNPTIAPVLTSEVAPSSYASRGQSYYRSSTEKPAVVTESNYLQKESTQSPWFTQGQWKTTVQETTKYFNPTIAPVQSSEVTQRAFPSRGQSNQWRSTEKPSVVTESNWWKQSTQSPWVTQTIAPVQTSEVTQRAFTSRGQSNQWRSTEKPAVVSESNWWKQSTQSPWVTQSHKKRVQEPIVPIIDSQNYVYGHSGNFHYSYEGADGTKAFEKGSLKTSQFSDGAGQSVEGNFSYKDKDGNDINVSYTADENGYRPVGAHLPTPPPIPPAIQRVLAILATKTTPEPVTEKFKAF